MRKLLLIPLNNLEVMKAAKDGVGQDSTSPHFHHQEQSQDQMSFRPSKPGYSGLNGKVSQSETKLNARQLAARSDYSSIHSDRFQKGIKESLDSGENSGPKHVRSEVGPRSEEIHQLPKRFSKVLTEKPEIGDGIGFSSATTIKPAAPKPRSPHPSPHPALHLNDQPVIVEKEGQASETTPSSVWQQLVEEQFLKDQLLSENISLRMYIQQLEESATVGEVLSLRAQVKELREINEECRQSLAVAVEGLQQAKQLEEENKQMRVELQTREQQLRQEFLNELENLTATHNREIQELESKFPGEEQFFNMQQLMEENSQLKERLSQLSRGNHKNSSLHLTHEHSTLDSAKAALAGTQGLRRGDYAA